MKSGPILIALATLAMLAGGGWWWQAAGVDAGNVRAALPPVPDLASAPPVLRERIAGADTRARRRLTAKKGLRELARVYHANGFLAEAARCYGCLERLVPEEPRWPHLHASILAGFGEIDAALPLWRQVIRLAPDYVPARLRLGDCLLKSNQSAAATAAYADVLQRSPENAYALLGLARIDLEAERWDQARERLERVVNRTNFNLGYDLIVSLYERMGQRERAEAIRGAAKASGAYRDAPDPWLDGLIDDCLDPYRLALSAGIVARSGESATAVRLLERAIALAPEDVSCHFQLGTLSATLGNFTVAREQLEKCTSLAPHFADGWAHLSVLEAQNGEVAAAERTLQSGLANCPDSPGLHLLRAHNLKRGGQIGEAMGELRTSIRLRPNEPEAYVELANLYIEQGRETEGIEQLRAALEADPGEPIALGILAFHAITTGDEVKARQWLTRVSLQPRVPPAQAARLAETYRRAFGRDWIPPR